MIGAVLMMTALVGLLFYVIYSWYIKRQNIKAADENVMGKILEQIRSKKKATEKITVIEFLNLPPKLVSKIINNMLEKDLIRVDKTEVSISEFGKHYYDKFLKRK